MKRLGGDLYNRIISKDNLLLAHENARKGKTHYKAVKEVEADLDRKIEELHQLLLVNEFKTSEYKVMEREEGGKLRVIHSLPYYPDRIVQHAILQQVGDRFHNALIRDTFQSLRGRGTSDARKRVYKFIVNNHPSHYMQMDIHKFYPSVNNNIMKNKVRKIIKCEHTLELLDNIIDSCEGLPIGNYTSQILGNYYLSDFDWFVKQELKVKGYFRYCDDLIFLGSSAKELHAIRDRIILFLQDDHLKVKPTWKLAKLNTGCDFIGFQFYPLGLKLRSSIYYKAKDALKNNYKAVPSYFGWVKVLNDSSIKRRYYNAINCKKK